MRTSLSAWRGRRVVTAIAAAAASAAIATGMLVAPASAAPDHHPEQSKQVIGYFTQWGIYSGNFEKNLIANGEVQHLTELDYAFSNIAPNGTCTSGDSWADFQRPFAATESVTGVADQAGQALMGNFNQLKELKAANPHLKIVMGIGGWSWSSQFSGLAQTAAGRQAFVQSCVDQYIRGNIPGLAAGAAAGIFDGISVDWEYPGAVGNNNPHGPQDTPDFTALIHEFRGQLDAQGATTGQHYLLTADVSANPAIAANLQLRPVSRDLDWFNVMTFDFHGAWEATGPTDFASNTFTDPRDPQPANNQFSVVQSVNYFESQGVPAGKIGLAAPYYAHVWTGVAPGPNGDGLYQPATAGGATPNYNAVVTAPGTVH
ncbi:MAG TPA: glycoside hydrolase family 18 protein, partial [Pseudonocardiaceae bacterium]